MGKIRCSVLDMLGLRGLVDIQVEIFMEAVGDTCLEIKSKIQIGVTNLGVIELTTVFEIMGLVISARG